MKKKVNFFVVLFFTLLLFTLVFTGCDDGTTDPGSGSEITGEPNVINAAPALRAVPIAASTSTPIVLDSYTDGIKNYYLIDVGYIRNIYISTVAIAHYNGLTPISSVRTIINQETITEGLKETVSNSITVSDTQNHKAGIEAAWKKKFPVAGEFSAKLKYEWAGSWTNSNTSTRSTETSVAKTNSFTDSLTTSFTIGGNNEPPGYYRYALYAICDVYFIISTSLDNQQLLSWDTAVCARDNSYLPHMDFSPEGDGIFDNSPIENEINFAEDFHKNLKKPLAEAEPPVGPPSSPEYPNPYTSNWETIRTETQRITASGREKQHFDVVNFDKFGPSLNTMKQQGFSTVSFYTQLNVREINNGYQWIFLYNSQTVHNNNLLSELRFQHTEGKLDTTWWYHDLNFENIPIDKFISNEFVIRYGASGSGGDTWENSGLRMQLVFKK